jgi:hypothetical protein
MKCPNATALFIGAAGAQDNQDWVHRALNRRRRIGPCGKWNGCWRQRRRWLCQSQFRRTTNWRSRSMWPPLCSTALSPVLPDSGRHNVVEPDTGIQGNCPVALSRPIAQTVIHMPAPRPNGRRLFANR